MSIVVLLSFLQGAASQIDPDQLYPRPNSRLILGTASKDRLSRLRVDIILKREGLEASWVAVKIVRGALTFQLNARRPEKAYDIQRILLNDRELNCTTLGLAVPAMDNLFYSFPGDAAILRLSALPRDFVLGGKQLGFTTPIIARDPLFKRETLHRSVERVAYSLRRSGQEVLDRVDGVDVFVELKGRHKSTSLLRFQFLKKQPLGSEVLESLPDFNVDK